MSSGRGCTSEIGHSAMGVAGSTGKAVEGREGQESGWLNGGMNLNAKVGKGEKDKIASLSDLNR